jgi:TonB dependent receptor-like, beta-barrel/Carboxypeptidase regulatory-like domain/TonB-dependent Receptor Plug Domain
VRLYRLWQGALALLLILTSASLAAAPAGSSVRGVVRDSKNRPIENASVTLQSATSDWAQGTTTNPKGEFTFAAVPIGDYVLRVLQKDYVTVAQAVTVTSSSFPLAHIQLIPVGTSLETVTVAADAETTLVNSATPTTLVNREDIAQSPGANRSNSLAMITDFVPGAYVVHDQLHVRGGHQTAWTIDGVEIPNTNIASNLGPQIDPKDIDYLEVQRGGYEADQGDRTYGVFNVIPRTGFERNNEAELLVSGGNYGQTNDYISAGSHTDNFAYYVSANGNRSDLGIQTPVAQIIHDNQDGYGAFATLVYDATPEDQIRFVTSARRDDYQIPNSPGDTLDDVQREADAFAILSWVRKFNPDTVLTSSVFYHYNRANLDAAANDQPISTTDQRSSSYAGGQETLRLHLERNDVQIGLMGFGQRDNHLFNVLFNDNSGNSPVYQALNTSGSLVAGYIQDTFQATSWWTLTAGVRQTHYSGGITENATSPRIGTTFLLPRLNWILRAYYGKYYQAPPLETISGPLLVYAQNSNLAFLPLRGERDTERQFGITIPVRGWTIDMDHFVTRATNFFDHNPIGNSNVFLPITIDGALIRAWELTLRSPRMWDTVQVHLAYSNQTADGIGGINGGLTDFGARGYFALDHDQRNTVNAGLDARLPWQTLLALNISGGSGFSNGAAPPSHLPGHAEADIKIGKTFAKSLTASISVLNLTNRHLLIDNSLTFGGFHYNNPRQVFGELQYRFGY